MTDRSPWDPCSPEGRRLRRARARVSRRGFLGYLAAASAALGLLPGESRAASAPGPAPRAPRRAGGAPRAIASGNGLEAVTRALELAGQGRPLLEAAVAGVTLVEDDPDDMSVGYGGLPNEDGVVELDAAVMDGATHRAGAVAALRDIRNPARVALKVMQRSDHVMLVGAGARAFALAHGFQPEDLLTDKARERWLRWKETLSDRDDWLPGTADDEAESPRPGGTIHLSLLGGEGDVACVTTTSGMAFKLPGRVGDSPILGAGLYCTNEAGSCGATGRGEAVILESGSFAAVEHMRHGHSPEEACLEVLRRIERHAPARHRDADGRPVFNVHLFAQSVQGDYAGACLQPGGRFAVADAAGGARKEDMVALL